MEPGLSGYDRSDTGRAGLPLLCALRAPSGVPARPAQTAVSRAGLYGRYPDTGVSAMTQPITRLAKTAPAEYQLAFSPAVWVATIMGRPSDCRCTWVASLGGFALKFRDHDCPAQFRHG